MKRFGGCKENSFSSDECYMISSIIYIIHRFYECYKFLEELYNNNHDRSTHLCSVVEIHPQCKINYMKKISIRVILASALLVLLAVNSFGLAAAKTAPTATKKHTKIDKTKVPKDVTMTFYNEYPTVTYQDWYDYPSFNYSDDWYDYDPYWYSDNPTNYAVEFTMNNVPYKSIYTKAGKKIATHKVVTSDLPIAVLSTIGKSQYKTWALGKDKEEIFKDKDSDQMKVYKVTVTMGSQNHTLYIQKDGKVLKDKKVS